MGSVINLRQRQPAELLHISRELMLNALDAMATAVVVNYNSRDNILTVTDDGEGIRFNHLHYVGLRGYTTKKGNSERATYGRNGTTLNDIRNCSASVVIETTYDSCSSTYKKILVANKEPLLSLSRRKIFQTGTRLTVNGVMSLRSDVNTVQTNELVAELESILVDISKNTLIQIEFIWDGFTILGNREVVFALDESNSAKQPKMVILESRTDRIVTPERANTVSPNGSRKRKLEPQELLQNGKLMGLSVKKLCTSTEMQYNSPTGFSVNDRSKLMTPPRFRSINEVYSTQKSFKRKREPEELLQNGKLMGLSVKKLCTSTEMQYNSPTGFSVNDRSKLMTPPRFRSINEVYSTQKSFKRKREPEELLQNGKLMGLSVKKLCTSTEMQYNSPTGFSVNDRSKLMTPPRFRSINEVYSTQKSFKRKREPEELLQNGKLMGLSVKKLCTSTEMQYNSPTGFSVNDRSKLMTPPRFRSINEVYSTQKSFKRKREPEELLQNGKLMGLSVKKLCTSTEMQYNSPTGFSVNDRSKLMTPPRFRSINEVYSTQKSFKRKREPEELLQNGKLMGLSVTKPCNSTQIKCNSSTRSSVDERSEIMKTPPEFP